MHTKTIPFQALTDNGSYVGQAEEFNTEQFRTMMKGELWRYSRRQLANAIQVSGDEKFSSMIVMLKLMEMHMHEKLASIEACVLEDKCENERERARTNDRLDEVLTILRALPQSSVQRGDRGGAEGNDWSGGVGKLELPPPRTFSPGGYTPSSGGESENNRGAHVEERAAGLDKGNEKYLGAGKGGKGVFVDTDRGADIDQGLSCISISIPRLKVQHVRTGYFERDRDGEGKGGSSVPTFKGRDFGGGGRVGRARTRDAEEGVGGSPPPFPPPPLPAPRGRKGGGEGGGDMERASSMSAPKAPAINGAGTEKERENVCERGREGERERGSARGRERGVQNAIAH